MQVRRQLAGVSSFLPPCCTQDLNWSCWGHGALIMKKGSPKSEIKQKQLYSPQKNASRLLGLRSGLQLTQWPWKGSTSLLLKHKSRSRCSGDNKEGNHKFVNWGLALEPRVWQIAGCWYSLKTIRRQQSYLNLYWGGNGNDFSSLEGKLGNVVFQQGMIRS